MQYPKGTTASFGELPRLVTRLSVRSHCIPMSGTTTFSRERAADVPRRNGRARRRARERGLRSHPSPPCRPVAAVARVARWDDFQSPGLRGLPWSGMWDWRSTLAKMGASGGPWPSPYPDQPHPGTGQRFPVRESGSRELAATAHCESGSMTSQTRRFGPYWLRVCVSQEVADASPPPGRTLLRHVRDAGLRILTVPNGTRPT